MPNLIPQKRLDRNGRLVTKHVRSEPKQSLPSGAIPSPTIAPQKKTVIFPDNSHKVPFVLRLSTSMFDNYEPSDELVDALCQWHPRSIAVQATSQEAYSVLSVLPFSDAALMLSRGVESAEEAKTILAEHSLSHLMVDNSGLMDEAMERRIPARSYMSICTLGASQNISQEQLLDAAEAHGMKALRDNYSFYSSVLRGDILLKDLKAVGVANVVKNPTPESVNEYLRRINKGEADFGIKEVKKLVLQCNKEGIDTARAWGLIDKFGMDFTLQRKSISDSLDMLSYLQQQKVPKRSAKPIIEHFDAVQHERDTNGYTGPYFDPEDVLKFYKAGIDPKTTLEALSRSVTVEQQLAINSGIESSLSGGWL